MERVWGWQRRKKRGNRKSACGHPNEVPNRQRMKKEMKLRVQGVGGHQMRRQPRMKKKTNGAVPWHRWHRWHQ